MNACRYLVRLFSGGISKWNDDSPPIETLAKVFNLGDSEHSVYEVVDGEEECLAAAAHKLSDPTKTPEAVSVLRIHQNHLPTFGIKVDEGQFGTTGIPKWDCRHWNLLADRAKLIELVGFLAGQHYRGHDQVRRIEKCFVVRSLNAFATYSNCHCPCHTRQIAEWCQHKKTIAKPKFDRKQLGLELASVEFEDDVIRSAAYRISSGDAVADWYSSLNSIRRSNAEHCYRALEQRFQLT